MKQLRNLLAAVALFVGLCPAAAQVNLLNIPANTVVGRSGIGPGPAQPIPFATLINTLLSGAINPSSVNTNSIVYKGATSGQATISAQAVAGTTTIKWPTTSGTLANNATAPIVVDPVTGNISCPGCGINIATRTAAISTDLHLFAGIQTGGYAALGDGGSATFTNVGSAAFIDTNVTTGTFTNGTGSCTNGTYYGVSFSGGSGALFMATVVVSGNIVTSVTQTGTSPGYTIGNVLSATITGCSATVTFTVTGLSTPTGSFTDLVGTHFQIVYPAGGVDVRQFGVKLDWVSVDGSATDNFTTLSNALSFAGAQIGSGPDTGGKVGGKVLLPAGTAMICGSNGSKALQIPYGVWVQGHGANSSILKICDAWGANTNYVELCNTQSHLACFSTLLSDLQIFSAALHDTGTNANGFAAIYSNNIQQEGAGLRDVLLYPGACRVGLKLEIGYGGASTVEIDDFEIRGGQKAANCASNQALAVSINFGTTQAILNRFNLSGLSASFNGPRDQGMGLLGGVISIYNFYAENIVQPIIVNITGGLQNNMVTLRGFHAGTSCGWGVTLASSNTPANFLIGGPMAINSCSSGMVLDSQPGGSNMTTAQVADKTFNP